MARLAAAMMFAGVSASLVGGAAAAPRVHVADYIVVLNDDIPVAASVSDQARTFGLLPTHVYEHALHGYAARFSDAVAERLAADPSVASVVPDGVVESYVMEPSAPWGLDRSDQRHVPLSGTYGYATTGAGVTVYVIDSGIRFTHVEFGGRATSGFDAVDGGTADDCYGHGTHVAGIVGGKTYGAAKGVVLKAVRVSDCTGYADWSTVIAGIDWITADHQAGAPAIANMSLGGARNSAADAAVKGAIADGVWFVAAAGNSASDACGITPAGLPDVITVAASTKSDAWASFSNKGPCVDLAAPGTKIPSALNTSDTATAVLTGTSMSAPLVAGIGARYLQTNPRATLRQFTKALKGGATAGVLKSVPANTANMLVYRDPGS
jgi:subtilisin family serine protease